MLDDETTSVGIESQGASLNDWCVMHAHQSAGSTKSTETCLKLSREVTQETENEFGEIEIDDAVVARRHDRGKDKWKHSSNIRGFRT